VVTWRLSFAFVDARRVSRALPVGWRVVAAFVVGRRRCVQARGHRSRDIRHAGVRLAQHSAPGSISCAAAGHPLHPLFGSASMRAYEALDRTTSR